MGHGRGIRARVDDAAGVVEHLDLARQPTLQREDRGLKLDRRRAKKVEGGEKKEVAKPRSGRPVTPRALNAAMTGSATVSGPTKQRILRAVNFLLEQKKKDKVELKTLF